MAGTNAIELATAVLHRGFGLDEWQNCLAFFHLDVW